MGAPNFPSPATLLPLAAGSAVGEAILLLCVIAVAGLAIGAVRVRGVGLGSAGVMFAGIAAGHFGYHIEHGLLEFVREFGLILFVFTIGLQLGPGFFASLRKDGLWLNVLAAVVVLGGAALALGSAWVAGGDFTAALGIFSGATTNTPSLGAAQQALEILNLPPERTALPALAYAVAYPVGIIGIIASLLILRASFRIDPQLEAERFVAEQRKGVQPLERRNLTVENPNLSGVAIADVPGRRETGVILSRIRRAGETAVSIATEETVLRVGDTVLAVGTAHNLEQFQRVVGRVSDLDLMQAPGAVTFRRAIVTDNAVLGKTPGELGLDHLFNVTVTRVTRADVEMTAIADLRLQFGDMLQIVGDEESLARAAKLLGNSKEALNATQFIPVFMGIALGVIAGMVPMYLGGLPVPVRLGLAGGPLVIAILLGRLGHVGPLVWHMPVNTNMAFRELGIILFLACVGLKAGAQFFETAFSADGARWFLSALVVTLVPLLAVGAFARGWLRLNFVTISGLLAGSMTDPPALAFANAISKSNAPTVGYATVYPLTMLLRIILAELMALVFCR